jgi:hypothetical protein
MSNLDDWIRRAPEMRERMNLGMALCEVVRSRPRIGLMLTLDVVTLEEVATKTREDVLAVHGVGPKTIAMLDVALAVEGLSYAEAI